jgi:hypothetical protein
MHTTVNRRMTTTPLSSSSSTARNTKRPRLNHETLTSQNITGRSVPTSNNIVQVVACTAAFPISKNKRIKQSNDNGTLNAISTSINNKSKNYTNNSDSQKNQKNTKVLDWNETVREVQKFGAQGWGTNKRNIYNNDDSINANKTTGNTIIERKKFRLHQEEEYERLTGKKKKHHSVPLPIVRGIKRKAIAREQRMIQEARDSGIVLPQNSLLTTKSVQQKQLEKKQITNKINNAYGPSPSIGFMKHGVLRVSGKK